MRKLLVFLIGMLLFLQQGQSQNIARHYWLNKASYNHTLYPTSDGGYILAAARSDLGFKIRNTIAVFKLDQNYQIQNSRIIGVPMGVDEKGIVNFEIHDVVETMVEIVDDDGDVIEEIRYVICGSMSRYTEGDAIGEDEEWNEEDPPIPMVAEAGMVLIIDANLQVQSFRRYLNVKTFYSVYADENHYYVCGKTPSTTTVAGNGIILRDNLFTMNPTSYRTAQPWVYHKLKLNTNGTDLIVSGTDYNEIGFTAFTTAGGSFAPVNNTNPITMPINPYESWKFSIPSLLPQIPLYLVYHSKVVLTNDPNNPQGLILSAQAQSSPGVHGNEVLTFLFNNYQTQPTVYAIDNLPVASYWSFLEDVSTSPAGDIAWVGNIHIHNVGHTSAFYLSTDLSFSNQADYILFYSRLVHPDQYFALHKVHFNQNDGRFHCGGFYNHDNRNKTTFVASYPPFSSTQPPVSYNCNEMMLAPEITQLQSPLPHSLPIIAIDVIGMNNPWYEKQYNFCDTDCDETPLNIPSNSNCGNQQ